MGRQAKRKGGQPSSKENLADAVHQTEMLPFGANNDANNLTKNQKENCRENGSSAADTSSLPHSATKLARAQDEVACLRQQNHALKKQAEASERVAALESHVHEIAVKMQALCRKNDELRTQRDAASASAKGAHQAREELQDLRLQLTQVRRDCNAKITAAEADRDKISEERLSLMASLAHKEKRMMAIEADAREKVQQAVSEAEERLRIAEKAIKEHQAVAEAAQKQAAGLHQAAEEASHARQAAEEYCAQRDAAVAEAESESAKTAAAEAQRAVEQLRAEAERSAELSRQLEERRAAVKAGDIRAAQLERSLHDVCSQLHEATAALKQQDAVTLALENDLSAAEKALGQATAQEQAATARADAMAERVTVLEEELSEAQSALESKEWRIEDLRSQVTDLKEAVFVAQEEVGVWRSKAEHATQHLDQLAAQRTTDIEDVLRTLHAMEEEVAALKAAAARKDFESKALRNELLASKGEGAGGRDAAAANLSLLDEIEKLHSRIAHLESSLARSREEMGVTAAEAAANAAVIEQLEVRLVEAESQIAAAHAGRAAVLAESRSLRTALELATSETERVKRKLEEAKRAKREATAASTAAAEALQKELQELQEDLMDARDAMQGMQRNDEVEAVLITQRQALQQAHQKAAKIAADKEAKLSAALQAATQEAARLSGELKSRRSELSKREGEGKRLVEERDALLTVVGELQSALAAHEKQHTAAVSTLQKKLETQKVELDDATGKIRATEAFIEKLTAAKLRESASSEGGVLYKENRTSAGLGGKASLVIQERGVPLRSVDANATRRGR